MYFRKISLVNFKCYKKAEVDFHPRLNCIAGRNGSGKTNLMDALYYAMFTKSYFSGTDAYVFRHGSDFIRLKASVVSGEREMEMVVKVPAHGKRSLEINGAESTRRTDYIDHFSAVMIAPDDNQLILGGSEGRRKFMDGAIGQYRPKYLRMLLKYQKLLKQRNTLLKQALGGMRSDPVLMESLEMQMSACAVTLFEGRKEFVELIRPVFAEAYKEISGEREEAEIIYDSELHEREIGEIFRQNKEKDAASGRTTGGLHRDDLEFRLDGQPLKSVGSQGQQKSFLVALKLAQYDLIRRHSEKVPVLFLDDLFDKFDASRVSHLVEMIAADRFGQVFITDTDEKRITGELKKHNLEYRLIRVEDATISYG